jgi:hypothetical protein
LAFSKIKNPIPLPTRNGVQSNFRFIPFLLGKRIREPNSLGIIAKWGKMSSRLGWGRFLAPKHSQIGLQ